MKFLSHSNLRGAITRITAAWLVFSPVAGTAQEPANKEPQPEKKEFHSATAADLEIVRGSRFAHNDNVKWIAAAAYSPDGTLFAYGRSIFETGRRAYELQIRRIPSGELFTKIPITIAPRRLFWQMDMKRIGYTDDQYFFHIVDLTTQKDIPMPIQLLDAEVLWETPDAITSHRGGDVLETLDLNTLKSSITKRAPDAELMNWLAARTVGKNIKRLPVTFEREPDLWAVSTKDDYRRRLMVSAPEKFWPSPDSKYIISLDWHPGPDIMHLDIHHIGLRRRPSLRYVAQFNPDAEVKRLDEDAQKFYRAFRKEKKHFYADVCRPVKNPLNGTTVGADRGSPIGKLRSSEWKTGTVIFDLIEERDNIGADAVIGPLRAQYDGHSVEFMDDFWIGVKAVPDEPNSAPKRYNNAAAELHLAPSAGTAQEPPKMPESQKEQQWLAQFVGEWETEAEATMPPGRPPVKGKGTEGARMLGGFWIVVEGKSEMMGTAYSHMMTLGYDPAKKKYVGTWIDSMLNHMWKYEGSVDATGKILTLEAEGPNHMAGGKLTKFRDVTEFKSKDHRVLSSSMLGEDGKWVTFMTGNMRRKK